MSSAHSPTFPSLLLCHNSFSNPSVALPKSQLILQPFCCFTYVTLITKSVISGYTLLFSIPTQNKSMNDNDVPWICSKDITSQFILQPFFCFSYVTSSSLNSPGEPPMQRWAYGTPVKYVPKLWEILYPLAQIFPPCLPWLQIYRLTQSRRDFWLSLYINFKMFHVHSFLK